VELLREAVPALTDAQLAAMQRCPMRSYDPSIVQEPHVYRTQEVRAEPYSIQFNFDFCGLPTVQEAHVYRTQEVHRLLQFMSQFERGTCYRTRL
jgi:hypothetical protein